MTIAEYRTHNATSLDSSYRTAMHVDSTKAVFGDRRGEFWDSWQKYWNDLGGYLRAHGFEWKQETQCTTRIYFNKDGGVDHFLYSFRQGALDPAEQQRFDERLNEFVETHDFPLTSDVPFSQCGPVLFQPQREEAPKGPSGPPAHP